MEIRLFDRRKVYRDNDLVSCLIDPSHGKDAFVFVIGIYPFEALP